MPSKPIRKCCLCGGPASTVDPLTCADAFCGAATRIVSSAPQYRMLEVVKDAVTSGDEISVNGGEWDDDHSWLGMTEWPEHVRFRRPLNQQGKEVKPCEALMKSNEVVSASNEATGSPTVHNMESVAVSNGAAESHPLPAPTLEEVAWTLIRELERICQIAPSVSLAGEIPQAVQAIVAALQSATAALRAENERLKFASNDVIEERDALRSELAQVKADRDGWSATHNANVAEHGRLVDERKEVEQKMELAREGYVRMLGVNRELSVKLGENQTELERVRRERNEAVGAIDKAFAAYGKYVDWLATPREEIPANMITTLQGKLSTAQARVKVLEALREDKAMLQFIRENCRVIYFPPSPAYPIEHAPRANKDSWNYLMDALRAALPDSETKGAL